MPYVPYLYYSITINDKQENETTINSNVFLSSDSLIGDICYIKAIKKRAGNNVPISKKEHVNIIMVNNLEVVTPFAPNTNIKHSNSIYKFGKFLYLIIEKIKDIDIPPPKETSLC